MTPSKVRWERSLQPDRTLQLGWTHRLVVKWRGEDVILVCNIQIWVYCSLPKLGVYFDLQNFFFFFFPFTAAEIGSVLCKVEGKTNNVACMVWGIVGALKHLCAELPLQSDLSEWLEPFFGKKKKISLKNAGSRGRCCPLFAAEAPLQFALGGHLQGPRGKMYTRKLTPKQRITIAFWSLQRNKC